MLNEKDYLEEILPIGWSGSKPRMPSFLAPPPEQLPVL